MYRVFILFRSKRSDLLGEGRSSTRQVASREDTILGIQFHGFTFPVFICSELESLVMYLFQILSRVIRSMVKRWTGPVNPPGISTCSLLGIWYNELRVSPKLDGLQYGLNHPGTLIRSHFSIWYNELRMRRLPETFNCQSTIVNFMHLLKSRNPTENSIT
jgi:hypothetical protein